MKSSGVHDFISFQPSFSLYFLYFEYWVYDSVSMSLYLPAVIANTDDATCVTLISKGCTDESMYNYDALANFDDGTCYTLIEGCTDSAYFEYDSLVTFDDGTCNNLIILGCMDDGFIEYKFKEGQSIKVGEIIALIHDSVFESKIEMNESKNDSGSKVISAAADAYIQENDIDISNINKKFITLKDLLKEETIPIFDDNYADNKVQLSSLKTKSKPIEYSKKAEIKALSSVNTGGLISTISIYVNAVTIETEDGLFSNTNNSYLPIIIYETSKLLKKYPIKIKYLDGQINTENPNNIYTVNDFENQNNIKTLNLNTNINS